MNNSIIAYDIGDLEIKKVLSKAEKLLQSNVLSREQWQQIRKAYATNLYSPNIFMKALLFLVSFFGITSILGPLGLLVGAFGDPGTRILSLILGSLIIVFIEIVMIKEKQHYKSGVTEAGIYSGLSFIAFGLLAFETDVIILYPIVGLLLATIAAVRYLDLLALASAFVFLIWIIFQILSDIGGTTKAVMPFVFMTSFLLIYFFSKNLEKKLANVVFEAQFVLVKTISLILFYVACNYFVVRELSILLMDLKLSSQGDIPFAYIFYFLTAFVPLGYLYWGVRQKSILLIRVGLITIALSVITFKYYFNLGHPMLIITITGAFLIAFALILFNYLKKIPNGFTAQKLLHDKWSSSDLTAFIASQTLGGSNMNGNIGNDDTFSGGSGGASGGGGATDEW